jgi:hypothetical protein
MRSDMVAAYLDIATTGKLWESIQRGEAPRPTATRLFSGRRVPVWSRAECDAFIQRRHESRFPVPIPDNDNAINAAELI